MRPDINFVKQKFSQFNGEFFGGELNELPIKLSNSRSTLGCFVHPRNQPDHLERGVGECYIRISTRLDFPQSEVEDTIIHEMIHYWIYFKRLKDSSAHGKIFRAKMEEINRVSGRNLKVSHRLSNEEANSDTHTRNNLICVTEWTDGRTGITVCARTRIFEIDRIMRSQPTLTRLEWFWSRDVWFNRFPISRVAKVYYADPDDLREHLKRATLCVCDGKKFYPAQTRPSASR